LSDEVKVISPLAAITFTASVSMLNKFYTDTYGIKLYEPRCCNLFGFDLQYSRLIPNTILKCLEGKNPIVYQFEGQEGARQYLYVGNATYHFILRMDEERTGIENICSKKLWKSSEIIIEILRYFPKMLPQYEESDFVEITEQSMIPNPNFKEFIDFNEGIKRTVDDYRMFMS